MAAPPRVRLPSLLQGAAFAVDTVGFLERSRNRYGDVFEVHLPGMGKFVVTDYLSYGPVAVFNLIRSMLAYPTTERIAELLLPTLVVLGSRDPFVSERWVKRRATGLPHVTAVTIEGAAHAINFSQKFSIPTGSVDWHKT